MKALGLFLFAAIVYALHQDFWNWTNKTLVFGILPVGLAYHAGYSVLCAITMYVFVKFAWPDDLENVEPQTPSANENQ